MEERQETVDNSMEAPSNEGQVEDTAQSEEITRESVEQELGQIGMGEQTIDENQDNTVEETKEPQPEENKYTVKGQEYTAEELANQYAKAREQLSERNEKAKKYEQVENFFKENKEVAEVLKTYNQPEFQTLYKAYQNGMINKNQLQKAQQYFQQQQQPQQQNQQQQINPNQIKDFIQQEVQKNTQNIQRVTQAKNKMQNDFKELQNTYSDVMQEMDLDFETLGEYAIKNKYVDDNRMPDMKKALNHYVADNSDVFSMMQKLAKNDVQKKQAEKSQAEVERPSIKNNEGGNDDSIFGGMKQYINSSGGGVL
jgi:uncharacterized protein YPO0396